ncbi:LysM peptidoglycan-binding domain-containing protein [Paenibacillus naphthalenovorans]|uniref:LysM peptidoglycan-binding domain-containing protein n=1 Tax=Paenibacillus naphthalenovorans TaxID=162209 RepID=UPI003D2D6287
MSTLQFHLSFNNGAERLQLPVNPESIRITTSQGYEDVEVTQLGEYTVIGDEKLREFTFSSFFPREYHPSYCEYAGFRPPWEIVRMVESWMTSGRPMRFTLTGQIYGDNFTEIFNTPATIRNFSYEERGGAVGDIYYDLTLKEYRFIEFQRIKTMTAAVDSVSVTTEAERPDTSDKLTEYTVVSGDSLFKIASKSSVYADGDQWRRIYSANKTLIGPNPNAIKPGQKLVIPRD